MKLLNLAADYAFVLDNDPLKALRCYNLLLNAERYVNGATVEMRRIGNARSRIKTYLKKLHETGKYQHNSSNILYLSLDTHFYFICVDKVYKSIERLSVELNDEEIKLIANELKNKTDILTVRGHFEHVDARAAGFLSLEDERVDSRKHISDFGNFNNENYTFDGKMFSCNKESVKLLKNLYINLVNLLHEKYASNNPKFKKYHVINLGSNVIDLR